MEKTNTLPTDNAGNPIDANNPVWVRNEVMRTANSTWPLSSLTHLTDEQKTIIAKDMVFLLQMTASIGQYLDALKKIVFYRKQLDGIEQLEQLMEKTKEAVVDNRKDALNLRDFIFMMDKQDTDFFHGLVGTVTETAELAEAWINSGCSPKRIDEENVLEEVGDLAFYSDVMLQALPTPKLNDEAIVHRVRKLRKRYPLAQGFTAELALERRDKQ